MQGSDLQNTGCCPNTHLDTHLELQYLYPSITATVVLKEVQKLYCSLSKSITCS